MNLAQWSPSLQIYEQFDLGDAAAIDRLIKKYCRVASPVLREVIDKATAVGARTAVVEFRYVDADYRDEHRYYYAQTFRRYPSVTHRLHFITREASTFELRRDLQTIASDQYIGFSVMRPLPGAPVGRTILRPPKTASPQLTCSAPAAANLLGHTFSFEGTPFISQDAQLGVCAHAAIWMVAHYHHLRWGHPRVLPGGISSAVPSEVGVGRPTPSVGLTVYQMAEALTRIGLPPILYDLNHLPPGNDVSTVACRYLNSGMPVIAAAGEHAFVLTGYRRIRRRGRTDEIRFMRNDDEVGPYQEVPPWRHDSYEPWLFLLAPLPAKVYLPGEKAEILGRGILQAASPSSSDISYRSTVLQSTDFKQRISRSGVGTAIAEMYGWRQLPRWIWVVEAIDRSRRRAGRPCVVGEVVIDATDHLRDLRALAWRVPGQLVHWFPDEDRTLKWRLPEMRPSRSIWLGPLA